MKYLLDTDIFIYLINTRPPEVIEKFRQHRLEDIYLTSVSVFELGAGVLKSQRSQQNQKALNSFLQTIQMIDFDKKAAWETAKIRVDLEGKGTPIGAYDLMNAGIAAAGGFILVTNNTREFSRVDGLQVENWVE